MSSLFYPKRLRPGGIKVEDNLYKKIYKIVEKYDLMQIAFVSDDEYEPEAKDIAKLNRNLTVEEISKEIKNIFAHWFSPAIIPEDEKIYLNMAVEIKKIFEEENNKNAKR